MEAPDALQRESPDPLLVALGTAVARHRAGDPAGAVAICHDVLRQSPGHPEALYQLGTFALQAGRPAEAVEWLSAAVRAKGTVAAFHSNLGMALQHLGWAGAAVAAHRVAVGLEPNDAPGHYNLGSALRAAGQVEEAVACYHRSL